MAASRETYDHIEDIQISFKYTFEEYIDAYRLHYANLRRMRLNIVFSVILLLLGVGWCIFDGYSFLKSVPIYASVIWVAFLVSEYFLTPGKKFVQDPRLKEEHTLIISAEKIVFKVAGSTASLRWKQYSRYVENADFYLLYYSEETFLILPKKVFTPEQEENFPKILTARFKHEQT